LLLTLPAGVLLGLADGAWSIARNEYLTLGMETLALHALARSVVLGCWLALLATAGCVAITLLLRLPLPRWALWPGVVLATAAAAGVAWRLEIDHRLGVVYGDLGPVAVGGVAAWLAIATLALLLAHRFGGGARRVAAVLCGGGLLALVGVTAADAARTRALQRGLADYPNVLVIAIDALRADHAGCHGYRRDTTPFVDAVARDGVLFENACSNGNMTRLTVPSLFTLRFPSVLGLREHDSVLSPRAVTLAEVLRDAGWATVAYAPNPSLKARLGFGQGFDTYDDEILGRRFIVRKDSQALVNDRFLAWLRRHPGQRFFAYVHDIDPHAPYEPPPEHVARFAGDSPDRPPRPITEAEYERMNWYMRDDADGGDLWHYVDRYDAEVRHTNELLEELAAAMDELGVLDETIIVVTADHGESFLEHGEWEHGSGVHEELVHVPLVVRFPDGRHAGTRIAAPVHVFDIAATVLDVAGLPPPPGAQARSLMPLVTGAAETTWRCSYAEGFGHVAVRCPGWKLIHDLSADRTVLHDLQADPGECHDVGPERPIVREAMHAVLRTRIRENTVMGARPLLDERTLDRALLEQLRALGYAR
jgi:arylsulfatase